MSAPTPPPQPSRADRPSRIVAMVILAAIVVPVVWLVVTTAIGGRDAVDFDTPTTSELQRLTTTVP